MLKSSIEINVTELIDEEKKKVYYRISLYDDIDDVKCFNRYIISHMFAKATSINRHVKMICIGGDGFLKRFMQLYGSTFKKVTKKEVRNMREMLGLSDTFKAFNTNCLFIIPEKDIKNLEKIWGKEWKN